MNKHLKKKSSLKKISIAKKQIISLPVFTVISISFIAIVFLFLGGTFSPKNMDTLSGNTKIADYGGVENILKQNGKRQIISSEVFFNNQIISPPLYQTAANPDVRVLAAASGQEKWIDVNLTEQKLRAYEGTTLFMETPLSSGLPWTPTVKGVFNIWYKIKYTRMVGGSMEAGNFYDLPNVPFNMFFYGDYALHGAYWHNNFGHPMSHGCVNLPIPAAEKLFYWTTPVLAADQAIVRSSKANPGTKVVVHD